METSARSARPSNSGHSKMNDRDRHEQRGRRLRLPAIHKFPTTLARHLTSASSTLPPAAPALSPAAPPRAAADPVLQTHAASRFSQGARCRRPGARVTFATGAAPLTARPPRRPSDGGRAGPSPEVRLRCSGLSARRVADEVRVPPPGRFVTRLQRPSEPATQVKISGRNSPRHHAMKSGG